MEAGYNKFWRYSSEIVIAEDGERYDKAMPTLKPTKG